MPEVKLAGVMGYPVAHSRSPRLHGYWLKRYELNGYYIPMPVQPEQLGIALRALPALGFAGCNLTVPLKEQALSHLDVIAPEARRIGSVNTVICRADGELFGCSTDGFGFIENLREQAPLWQPTNGPALVLGAGGSARAVTGALLDAGVPHIYLANRSIERAIRVAEDLGGPIEPIPWPDRHEPLAECGLLVNTTTLGMTGQPALALDVASLPVTATIADLVYAPLETELLRSARIRGLAAVDGLGMLLHQARPGFKAWFGVEPEVDLALRKAVVSDGSP